MNRVAQPMRVGVAERQAARGPSRISRSCEQRGTERCSQSRSQVSRLDCGTGKRQPSCEAVIRKRLRKGIRCFAGGILSGKRTAVNAGFCRLVAVSDAGWRGANWQITPKIVGSGRIFRVGRDDRGSSCVSCHYATVLAQAVSCDLNPVMVRLL